MRILLIFFLTLGSSLALAVTDYQLNGVTQPVKQDTVTPGNSRPLPTQYLNSSGVRTDLATEATLSALVTNTQGVYAEITNLTTAAQTFTAPANARGFVIEALSSNTVNVRYAVGATATTTSGMRLEPGRSEFLPIAANISVIAESGTNQVVTVQWVVK